MGIYKVKFPNTVSYILSHIHREASVLGDKEKLVYGVASIEEAIPGILCFCSAEGEEAKKIISLTAGDVIIGRRGTNGLESLATRKTVILVEDPMLFFIECLNFFFPSGKSKGLLPGSFVDPEAKLEEGVLIEPTAVVDKEVYIGRETEVHSGVRVYKGSKIGQRVTIRSNAVIGTVGLGYGQEKDGFYVPFPHLGGVDIGDDVDVGANSTVVKGILTNTVVGAGTKIGNQVNIGHNVSIGRNCFISAGVIICGSAKIRDNCWIAPGSIILNKVVIGESAKVGLGSVVTKDVEPETMVAGMPARFLYHLQNK